MSLCGQVYVPDSWHMTLRLGNLRSESRGLSVLSPFPLNIVRSMTSGRSVSQRIVVEQKVFRTMERCAVLQATRDALFAYAITSPHPSPTLACTAQAHVQVLSRSHVVSHLVTKLEAPRRSRITMHSYRNKRYSGEVLSTPVDATAFAHDSSLTLRTN
jgi:hypothetical protein